VVGGGGAPLVQHGFAQPFEVAHVVCLFLVDHCPCVAMTRADRVVTLNEAKAQCKRVEMLGVRPTGQRIPVA